MIKILLKKKGRGASTFAASIICIFFMSVLFISLFFNFSKLIMQNGVERTYRKYLLRMEREGCLTSSDLSALNAELSALGLSDIDLSGTSLSPVGYGNEVHLHIKGNLQVDSVGFSADVFTGKKETIDIDIDKTGTALY